MLHLGIFGQEFENTIVIFDINALKFIWLENLVQKTILKFLTKNALFGYFWARIF